MVPTVTALTIETVI